MPLSWIAKSAATAVTRPPLTLASILYSILHSVKLPWNHPPHRHYLLSHYSIYWSPLQQAKQISFWLKTEVTGGKLKSLIVICSYWGIVDVSIPSPVTFAKLPHAVWCVKIIFHEMGGKLSFISKIVWSIIYDPANKPYTCWDEYSFGDLCASKAVRMCRHPFNWHVVYAEGNGVEVGDAGRMMGVGWGWVGVAECVYWRLDWKLIKLATVLHHSTMVPELSFKCSTLQAAITEAYRSPQWQGSAPNGSGQTYRFWVYVCRVWGRERGVTCFYVHKPLLWAAAARTSCCVPQTWIEKPERQSQLIAFSVPYR